MKVTDQLPDNNALLRMIVTWAVGIVQALVVATLMWVGNTVSQLNREAGELRQQVSAMQANMLRLERQVEELSRHGQQK